jgi:hypothetical protein
MRDTICQITAQYYENYSDSVNPHWKPKGSQLFTIMVDADDFMYSPEIAIQTIEELLFQESNSHCRFEYREHELIFSTPHTLSSDKFEDIFSKKSELYYSK